MFIYVDNWNLHCPNDYVDITVNPQQSTMRICAILPRGFTILPSPADYTLTLTFNSDHQSPFSGFTFLLFLTRQSIKSLTSTNKPTIATTPITSSDAKTATTSTADTTTGNLAKNVTETATETSNVTTSPSLAGEY